MGADDGITTSSENYNRHDHYDSDNEVAGVDTKAFSGTLNERDGSKSVRFNFPDDAPGSSSTGAGGMKSNGNTETTLDVVDDTGAIHDHSVKTAGGADVEDPELTLLGKGLEKRSLSASLVRNASSRIRQVLTASTSKLPVSRTKSAAAPPALKGLKFINKKDVGKEWTECKNRFDDLTKETDGLLPRSLFWECIGMNKESKEFAGQLFDSLSRRRNIEGGRINKTQLEEFWDIIVDQSFDSSLRTFFEMVDKDANGRITKDEVRLIISLSASANKLSNIQNQADEYAALIMEELDPDNLGFIMIEELEFLLLQEPIYYVSVESKNLSRTSTQKPETTQHGNRVSRWYENFKFFLQDNWQRCWVLVLWIVAMVSLFTWKYVEYKQRVVYDLLGPCVCIAKGAAETLKLNMAIMLLPVCRNTITWLRNKTRLGVAVPFDDNIIFHQLIAMAIAIGVALHAISHLACDFPRLIHATEEEYAPLKQFFGDQAKSYWHFVKEVEGYTGITMVVLMTIAFTLATPWLRKRTLALPKKKIFANRLLEKWLRGAFGHFMKLMGFNAFWYSHHLFVIVYGMLIVHGIKLYLTKKWYKKTTWMYLAVPISLYACERLIRSFRSKLEPVNIRKAAVYQKNLVTLYMTKPQGFKYQSGQYMFVKCKAVSPFEWHPFSITSAPGDDYLSVHIKNNGDWTGKLIDIFTEACKTSSDEDSDIHIRYDHQLENSTFPKVVIDGPYGAPAQDYRKYDVVLLIGLGIGATPMISIVKDIVDDMRAKEDQENDLENGAGLQSGSNSYNKTRAYFYWMSREQGSYDWFDGVMNEIAEIDKNGIIEMHNHCTSVFEEGDVRSAIITTIQSLNYAKNGVDPVSGTRVKTHFAKPNWENVYRQMALNHPGSKIGVFYCGAPVAVKELKTLALKFSHETLTSTTFEFHKENF